MKTYTVASEEGAAHFGVQLGETFQAELEPEQERAVIAAGWLETNENGKEASG